MLRRSFPKADIDWLRSMFNMPRSGVQDLVSFHCGCATVDFGELFNKLWFLEHIAGVAKTGSDHLCLCFKI
jgi:hypothetical protein